MRIRGHRQVQKSFRPFRLTSFEFGVCDRCKGPMASGRVIIRQKRQCLVFCHPCGEVVFKEFGLVPRFGLLPGMQAIS